MTRRLILIAICSCGWAFTQPIFAATIPGGTNLVVRTVDTIHSDDRVGRVFTTKLDQDIAVKGTVLLKAGTKVLGKVEASRANPVRSEPLTLNLTGV